MTGNKYWTGVGSRNISSEEYLWAVLVGEQLCRRYGLILRSGCAQGADTAFQEGVCNVDPSRTEIWLPWESFYNPSEKPSSFRYANYVVPTREMIDGAEWYYTQYTNLIPYFSKMKGSVQRLHGRNYYQIVGRGEEGKRTLPSVCIFVADENSNGDISGGTRSAVLTARHHKVPTYNLRSPEQREKLFKLIGVAE